MTFLVFLASALTAALAWNLYRPRYAPARAATASWVFGWLVGELPFHFVGLGIVAALVLATTGVFSGLVGKISLLLFIGGWAGILRHALRSREAEGAMREALRPLPKRPERPRLGGTVDVRAIALPFPIRDASVEVVRDVRFHRVRGVDLRLDVYRPKPAPSGAPVLFEIHGGGWSVGSKNGQGLPLLYRMARSGWVCVTVNYRLSPHATYPEHLVDVKRGLAWVRRNIAAFGGDPDRVVAVGQSAGGHLASMLGLTPNRPEVQPGFEDVDTSVLGVVSFYGVYDFTNRWGHWPNDALPKALERSILKASIEEAPMEYRRASPADQVHEKAPPFLVVHGTHDNLVPVEEARRFVELLRAQSRAPVCYAEIPLAQHAFEIFPSWRAELVLQGTQDFLEGVIAGTAASGRPASLPRGISAAEAGA